MTYLEKLGRLQRLYNKSIDDYLDTFSDYVIAQDFIKENGLKEQFNTFRKTRVVSEQDVKTLEDIKEDVWYWINF